jgi:hypothetical protein
MDDLDMFWSNCETMTCADKERNQVGAYIQLLRTLSAATSIIAAGGNGALCKRTRVVDIKIQDMIILCGWIDYRLSIVDCTAIITPKIQRLLNSVVGSAGHQNRP